MKDQGRVGLFPFLNVLSDDIYELCYQKEDLVDSRLHNISTFSNIIDGIFIFSFVSPPIAGSITYIEACLSAHSKLLLEAFYWCLLQLSLDLLSTAVLYSL